MSLELHTLKPGKGAKTKRFRVGRGEGSGSGKTAGRGTKGQRSRTGGRRGLKLKGLKQMILAFPKSRGFTSRFPETGTVPVERLMKAFPAAAKIDVAKLKAKGLIAKTSGRAKLVGTADVKVAYSFVGVQASETAKAAIEKAGGTFAREKKTSKKK